MRLGRSFVIGEQKTMLSDTEKLARGGGRLGGFIQVMQLSSSPPSVKAARSVYTVRSTILSLVRMHITSSEYSMIA